ncbi:pfs domain-containing protein [Ilyonectria robusta]
MSNKPFLVPNTQSVHNFALLSLYVESTKCHPFPWTITPGMKPNFDKAASFSPLNSSCSSSVVGASKPCSRRGRRSFLANAPSKNGPLRSMPDTSLQLNGHVHVARELLTHDPSQVNPLHWHGSTALFAAARNGHDKIVELLLNVDGVNFMSQDGFGRIPLRWAKRCGNPRVSELLLLHAEIQGTPMSEDQDAPDSNLLTPFGQGLRWCDACLLNIDTGSTYFYCEICNGGRFDVIDDPLGMEKFQGHENGTGSGNCDADNSDYRFDRENHGVEVLCAE